MDEREIFERVRELCQLVKRVKSGTPRAFLSYARLHRLYLALKTYMLEYAEDVGEAEEVAKDV